MEDHPPVRPGLMARIGIRLIGGDPARAQVAGHDDQARMVLLAATLLLITAWIGFNVAKALHLATGAPATDPGVLAIAGMVAGLYALFDQSLIQGHWWTRGRALAVARGFAAAPEPRGWGFLFGLLRVALAVTMAIFTAGAFALWYWQADISARLEADSRVANAALKARVEAEVDRDIAVVTAELDAVTARIADRSAAVAQSALAQAEEAEATRRTLKERLDELDAQIVATDDRIACANRTMTAEESGLVACDGEVVTDTGQGDRFKAAKAELDLLTAERAALISRRARTAETLSALPKTLSTIATDPESARQHDLAMRRHALLADRVQTVTDQMKQDPGFVPPETGLLARSRTLWALVQDESAVLVSVVAAQVLFVLLDLAAVTTTFGDRGGSLYALRRYIAFETRAAADIATGRTAQAEAEANGVRAEVARLTEQLALVKAEADLRMEIRRVTEIARLVEAMPTPVPPRFDA